MVRGERELQGSFEAGTGKTGTVSRLRSRRRSDQAHDVLEGFGFKWLGHADNGTHLIARSVVAGFCRSREQNNRHVLQTVVTLDDRAKIVAGNAFGFNFCNESRRDRGAENRERLISRRDSNYDIAILLEQITHIIRGLLIRLDREDDRLMSNSVVAGEDVGREIVLFVRRGALAFTPGVQPSVEEVHRDRKFLARQFLYAHDFRHLLLVEGARRSRVRKYNVQALTSPIA